LDGVLTQAFEAIHYGERFVELLKANGAGEAK